LVRIGESGLDRGLVDHRFRALNDAATVHRTDHAAAGTDDGVGAGDDQSGVKVRRLEDVEAGHDLLRADAGPSVTPSRGPTWRRPAESGRGEEH
jgi:hypothetical protein